MHVLYSSSSAIRHFGVGSAAAFDASKLAALFWLRVMFVLGMVGAPALDTAFDIGTPHSPILRMVLRAQPSSGELGSRVLGTNLVATARDPLTWSCRRLARVRPNLSRPPGCLSLSLITSNQETECARHG
jgi:hypothetical protein